MKDCKGKHDCKGRSPKKDCKARPNRTPTGHGKSLNSIPSGSSAEGQTPNPGKRQVPGTARSFTKSKGEGNIVGPLSKTFA